MQVIIDCDETLWTNFIKVSGNDPKKAMEVLRTFMANKVDSSMPVDPSEKLSANQIYPPPLWEAD